MTDFKREEYYGTGPYQPLDFWESLHMPASLATMLKYLVRAGKKDGESKVKDLKLVANNSKADTYTQYLNEIMLIDIPSISQSFNEVLKEAGVD